MEELKPNAEDVEVNYKTGKARLKGGDVARWDWRSFKVIWEDDYENVRKNMSI